MAYCQFSYEVLEFSEGKIFNERAISNNFLILQKNPKLIFWKITYFENKYSASENEVNKSGNKFQVCLGKLKFDRHPGKFQLCFLSGKSVYRAKGMMSKGPWD